MLRPPQEQEDREAWVGRAREAGRRGPLGHHTHWTSPAHARPSGGDPAARVREEAAWIREQGLEPRLFCGGGWYIDPAVAGALAELGYVDCTATAFRPSYLEAGAPRLALADPVWVRIDGHRLLEVPSTHSLGMAARAALSPLPGHVHVYFHDTDLLVPRRRLALRFALEVLGRRRTPVDLDNFAAEASVSAGEVEFGSLADTCDPDT